MSDDDTEHEDASPVETLTETEFDHRYGSANESPLHLTEENLAAFRPELIWTEIEDANGQGWLLNGVIGTGNVLGHWISVNPWADGLDDGDIRVAWGGDLENPEP